MFLFNVYTVDDYEGWRFGEGFRGFLFLLARACLFVLLIPRLYYFSYGVTCLLYYS